MSQGVEGGEAEVDAALVGSICVGRNGSGPVFKLESEDVDDSYVSDCPGRVKIAKVWGQNIHRLLYFLQRLTCCFVEDFKLELVPALSGREVDSIRVLVLGRDVDDVTACGETVVGAC